MPCGIFKCAKPGNCFIRSHSSAGQSVRLITVRSAARARVGPLLRTAAHACARSACRLAGLRPASCLNHELGCGQACTQPTSISVQIQMQASRSHSSAGQSVRLITVRSAAQARVGPILRDAARVRERSACRLAGLCPAFCLSTALAARTMSSAVTRHAHSAQV